MADLIRGFGITRRTLVAVVGVPPRRIDEIAHGERGITADTAMRRARRFGTPAGLWTTPPSDYGPRMRRRGPVDRVGAITALRTA